MLVSEFFNQQIDDADLIAISYDGSERAMFHIRNGKVLIVNGHNKSAYDYFKNYTIVETVSHEAAGEVLFVIKVDIV